MPVSKDSLKRLRMEDKLLSDPNYDYTTSDILRIVNRELNGNEKVTLRMIQKDIKALEEEFGKEMERGKGGRGTVRYTDQSTPLFYQQLTSDEEKLLREVLRTLGQFSGLENFTWLDLLKKKLDMAPQSDDFNPVISFSRNEGLQIPGNLIGRLFTAISRKQVIRVKYTKFGFRPKEYDVYPYQLRQFNDRWFLLCTPLAYDEFPYTPDFVINLALDRIDDFTIIEDKGSYIETPVNLGRMYDEIVGVTLDGRYPEPEDIFFAVKKTSVDYVRTKWIHSSQIEITGESERHIKKCYPSLKDCAIFCICCRMNTELIARFLSYGENLIVFDYPDCMEENGCKKTAAASEILRRIEAMARNYRTLARKMNTGK